MNQLALNKSTKNHNSNCSERIKLAEQELAAFRRAVTELFGSEQAEVSTEDWVEELAAMKSLPASSAEWRQITLNVSTRLAARANLSSLSTESKTRGRKRICVFSSQALQEHYFEVEPTVQATPVQR